MHVKDKNKSVKSFRVLKSRERQKTFLWKTNNEYLQKIILVSGPQVTNLFTARILLCTRESLP